MALERVGPGDVARHLEAGEYDEAVDALVAFLDAEGVQCIAGFMQDGKAGAAFFVPPSMDGDGEWTSAVQKVTDSMNALADALGFFVKRERHLREMLQGQMRGGG